MQTFGRIWVVDNRPVRAVKVLNGFFIGRRKLRKGQVGHVIIRMIAIHIAIIDAGGQRAVLANRVRFNDKIHLLTPDRMQQHLPVFQRNAVFSIVFALDENFRQISRRV